MQPETLVHEFEYKDEKPGPSVQTDQVPQLLSTTHQHEVFGSGNTNLAQRKYLFCAKYLEII